MAENETGEHEAQAPDPKSPVQFEGVTLHKKCPVTGRVSPLLHGDAEAAERIAQLNNTPKEG